MTPPDLSIATQELRDAQLELDYALGNWEQFTPQELGERASRWWCSREAFRQAVTEPQGQVS